MNTTSNEYVQKSFRTASEGTGDVSVTVYKDTKFTSNEEKKIDKEDDKPLLYAPDEDIGRGSVSEDNMFNDHSEEVDEIAGQLSLGIV